MAYRRRYFEPFVGTTETIGDKSITEDKIDDKAVGTAQLDDDAVTTEKIADGEVKTEDIGDQAVQTVDIKDGAVTEPKLADDSVGTFKYKYQSITGSKIVDGTITAAKMAVPQVTRPLTPVLDTPEIGDGKVTAAKLAGDAVETAKIKDDAVTSPKIAPDSIQAGDIAANAIEGAEIKDGAVGTGKLATDAVETVKIKDANVTEPKLELDILPKILYNRQIFWDDFLGVTLDDAWRANGDAGGSVAIIDLSEVQIGTDGDANDFYRLDWEPHHGVDMSGGRGRCVVRATPLFATNQSIFLGIYRDANNFVGFRVDTAVSPNWYAVSKAIGVETAVDTGIVATATQKKFDIFYPTVGGDIEFRIDDVLKTTITTNKFVAKGHLCLKVQALAAAARVLTIDLAMVSFDRL